MKLKVIVLSFTLLSFICGVVGWTLSRGTFFKLAQLEILTTSDELRIQIRDALVPFLGKNLLMLPLQDVEEKLRLIPRSQGRILKKHWPNTLVVHVQPKRMVAMFYKNKTLWGLDEDCRPVDPLVGTENLPLVLSVAGHTKIQSLPPKQVCHGLRKIQGSSQGKVLSYQHIDELIWSEKRGLILQSQHLDMQIELGMSQFYEGWQRAQLAYTHLITKGMRPEYMDASLSSRVVFRPVTKLQFFKNELNLKGLVHRKEDQSPLVR